MPFANLIGRVSALCPRLLINRDYVGSCEQHDPPMGFGNVGLRCGRADNYRDVFLQSDCDAAVQRLCTKLGWVQELEGVLKAVQAVPPEEAWLSLVREDTCARGGGQPEAGVGITPSSHSTTAKETAAQPASTAATPIHPRSRSPGTSSVETKKPLRSDGGKLPSKGLSPAKNQKINRTEKKKPPAAVASRQGKKSQPAKPVLPVLPASRQPLGTAAPLYDPLRAAADCIMAADAILICSGAGMGVDSGLGTYRGINAGNFGIDYEIICQPKWFQSHPDLAWGFWGRCYHAYTSATLHDGYGLLCAWGKRAPLGCFSVTSNVDGHWLRSGIGAERVWEVHGSVHQLQVDNILSSYEEVWASDADGAMSALELPAWELQPGQQVGVQLSLDGKWSDAQVAPDGRTILIKHTGKETSNVYGLRTQRDKDNNWAPDSDLLRVKPGCAFPGCPDAAQPPPDAEGQVMAKEEARPNILVRPHTHTPLPVRHKHSIVLHCVKTDVAQMFNDGDFKSSRVDAQKKVYYEWSEGLPPETKLAVIEIGVGTVIPKIRAKAELATHDFKNSTLIRINMGDFENVLNGTPGENGEKTERRICINMGALAALQGIDQCMQPVVKKSGTVAPSNSSNSLVRTSSVERQHASSVGTKISLLSGGVSKKESVKKVTTKNKAMRTTIVEHLQSGKSAYEGEELAEYLEMLTGDMTLTLTDLTEFAQSEGIPIPLEHEPESSNEQEVRVREESTERVVADVKWPTVKRADVLQAQMDITQLVKDLDLAMSNKPALDRATAVPAVGELDFDEEAKKLFARRDINTGLGKTPNLNPIWRHPKTGATVFVGNAEAAGDGLTPDGLLNKLCIDHIVDCRCVSKDGYASGDPVLLAGQQSSLLKPRRRFRFEIENYWRFCCSAKGELVACQGCQSAHAPCSDKTHTRLIESSRGAHLYFAPVMHWIDTATKNGRNVLIHCLAGAHRAGSTAVAFLMHAEGLGVREAVTQAKRCRPCIDPIGGFPGLLVQLDAGNAAMRACRGPDAD